MRYLRFVESSGLVRGAVSVADEHAQVLRDDFDFIEALQTALYSKQSFEELALAAASEERVDVNALIAGGRVRSPVPLSGSVGTCLVTGTGLTHVRSAEIRDSMNADENESSDTMKMYQMGKEAGRPPRDGIGVQPEWFFKGTGQCLVPSGADIEAPGYSLSAGEEVELAGVYYISDDLVPVRVGFVLVNDFSDHALESKNYLYLATSKLRECAIGPELLIGDAPEDVAGRTLVRRNGKVIWEREFRTGEANMTHSIANLEHHHFKHTTLLTPGDIHIHLLGCPVFSYGDGHSLADGDEIEISAPKFGAPLRNTVRFQPKSEVAISVRRLKV
ncbi:MAG: AraD1 family protein [Pseudomonadota bacterium]